MRWRLLVLALAICARPLFGAAGEVARPVQLSLDFAAAPKQLSVLPTLPPTEILTAFHTGDPAQFLAAVRAADCELPVGDDAQYNLLVEGLAREEADRIYFAGKDEASPAAVAAAAAEKPARQRRATKIDYDKFARRIDGLSSLSLNIFQDVETKREILRASGYTHLIGPGGLRIAIADANPARVGKAFAHVHRTLKNRQAP